MAFDKAYFTIGQLDRLSYRDSFVHRLDPRAKVIATSLFLVTVVSYPKYEVTALAPFFLFPMLLMTLGNIPLPFLAKKVLAVSPFALCIGIFNPLFDHATVSAFGLSLSAGWVSFASLMIKFTLTISAALLLIATTSFPNVCNALGRLGVPTLLVSQLLFLYRYLFVLMEETMRIVRARDMRSFGKRGLDRRVAARIIGVLFLRTVERAQRIYSAMLSRGFHGEIPSMNQFILRSADIAFVAATAVLLLFFRLTNVPQALGRFLEIVLR